MIDLFILKKGNKMEDENKPMLKRQCCYAIEGEKHIILKTYAIKKNTTLKKLILSMVDEKIEKICKEENGRHENDDSIEENSLKKKKSNLMDKIFGGK